VTISKFVCHSRRVLEIACQYGWKPGARYTNLRDVRGFERVGFLDIDWKRYSFKQHLEATRVVHPELTVAQDIIDVDDISIVLRQAEVLLRYADNVVIVPKDPRMSRELRDMIPETYILGYSVRSRYGGTPIAPAAFDGRAVHLLGGRPDQQRKLADQLNVVSVDVNRFTLDAEYGDYFDGETFRPHPNGGYDRCLEASIRNINALWSNYRSVGH
jgi:hypothetical protein